MKLVIQIPCYNEEENIFNVLSSIPKTINNIDEITTVLLDDGSSDSTVEIARKFQIQIIQSKHAGLSHIFKTGIDFAIENKADILVNLDGDNQYKAQEIEKLIQPIINNEADMTIGCRPINNIKTFSTTKKLLQRFGSFVVKIISGAKINDATSGFRAFNRLAILKTNIFNDYTYTIENIIQAKSKNLIIKNVDINVNPQENRKSKLIKNNFHYIFKQAINLLRFFIIYSPVKFFNTIAAILFLIGMIPACRFLFYYFNGDGTGHIQSLILSSILLIASFIVLNVSIVSDILSVNRSILEEILIKTRQK